MISTVLKTILTLFALMVAAIAVIIVWLWPRYDYAPAKGLPFSIERFSDQPLINTGMSERLSEQAKLEGFKNINGPSLIKVPDHLCGQVLFIRYVWRDFSGRQFDWPI